MVASGNDNNQYNQYSIRKKVNKKLTIMENIKTMWMAVFQKQNHKKWNEQFLRHQGYSKHKLFKSQKSNHNNDKKIFISRLCQYLGNSFWNP